MTRSRPAIAFYLLQKYIMHYIYIFYFAYPAVKLLKKLHLFYLLRFLRMLPLLATTLLLQVGVFHYIYDGPRWGIIADLTDRCRFMWWATLIFLQNFFQPMVCVPFFNFVRVLLTMMKKIYIIFFFLTLNLLKYSICYVSL